MYDWKNRRILVTGASKGFGFELAKVFAKLSARVAIVGRDAETLHQAAEKIQAESAASQIEAIVGDVSKDEDVDRIFGRIEARWQGLDVLINNVGQSARGRLLDSTPEAIAQSLDVNLLTVVRVTRRAAAMIIESKGSVVNIGSLAARTSAPFLGPYTTSKHALAGYTHQLRLELQPQGVHVLLVCPGPIARADNSDRYADQSKGLPDSAGKPGGGVQLKGLNATRLALQVVHAVQRKQLELVVPFRAKLLMIVSAFWPSLGDWVIRKMTRSNS